MLLILTSVLGYELKDRSTERVYLLWLLQHLPAQHHILP